MTVDYDSNPVQCVYLFINAKNEKKEKGEREREIRVLLVLYLD